VLLINNLIPREVMSLAPAGWTVGAEVLFYVVFPLLLLYVRNLWTAFGVLIATIVVSQLVRGPFSEFPLLVGSYADFSVVTFGPSFAFGVIAFLIFERMRAAGWGAADLAPARVWGFHGFFIVATAIIGAIIYYQIDPLREAGRADLVLAALFFALVTVWWTVRPARILNWEPIQYQAERSFSIYLMHALIVPLNVSHGRATYQFLEPYIGGWAMTPALIIMYLPVIIVSIITYALIERRGVEAGRAFDALFKRKPKSGPAPEAA
jgi:peptidoglycan/LPS O-acetylase OafA/YrhL